MDFLEKHWAVISANPWLFVTWSSIVASVAWAVIHFLYRHRIAEDGSEISRLRAILADLRRELAAQEAAPAVMDDRNNYEYPEAGDHGLNILGQTLTELVVDQAYSMTAKVPKDSVLKVQLLGSPPDYLEQFPAAWVYSTSTRNWQANIYDQNEHVQWFTARAGEAELAFIPRRTTKITVRVYEGSRNPGWEKELRVVDARKH